MEGVASMTSEKSQIHL